MRNRDNWLAGCAVTVKRRSDVRRDRPACANQEAGRSIVDQVAVSDGEGTTELVGDRAACSDPADHAIVFHANAVQADIAAQVVQAATKRKARLIGKSWGVTGHAIRNRHAMNVDGNRISKIGRQHAKDAIGSRWRR